MPDACSDERQSREASTFGEALQLGRLLKPVRPALEFDENGLPVLLDGSGISEWGTHAERVLRERFGRSQSLRDRTETGRRIRKAVLKVLQRLETGSSAAGLTRKQVSTLRQLVLLCARDQDWASMTGPIVGASNAVISRRLSTLDPAEALKPLFKRGLITHHKRRGNGHRFFRILNQGSDNERVEASGLSLGPLIVLLDTLEILASYEEELVEEHISLPRQTAATLNEARRLLCPHLDEVWAIEADHQIKEASARAHNAKRAGLERKRKELGRARQLLQLVEDRVTSAESTPARGDLSHPVGGQITPHIYSERENLEECCRGFPEDKGTECTSGAARSAETEDPYGLRRVGFDWSEVPHLFPFIDGLLRVEARHLHAAAYALGRVIGIHDLALTERAIKLMGLEGATLAMLITGQHSADDEIDRSPEVYLRGLVKRSRQGDLNMGHTIFGRRERANLNLSAKPYQAGGETKQRSNHWDVNPITKQSW